MSSKQTPRPVRVTLEGNGRQVGNALYVTLLRGEVEIPFHEYGTSEPGVTVEWLRDWRDGDVVLDDEGDAAQRRDGLWYWAGRGSIRSSDGDATFWATKDPSRVLRYQAGDQ